jgi:hypothetical protein
MQTIYVHVDAAGTWALTRCTSRPCHEVHKYLLAEARAGVLRCKSCGAMLDLRDATILQLEPGTLARRPCPPGLTQDEVKRDRVSA